MSTDGQILIYFKTACQRCGTVLDAAAYDVPREGLVIEVVPCDHCLDGAEAKGYERCERENKL